MAPSHTLHACHRGVLPCTNPSVARQQASLHPARKHCARCSAAAQPVTDAPVSTADPTKEKVEIHGIQHAAFIVESLERSVDFYHGLLGLDINPTRPDHKLKYRGAWMMVGPDMIHLMELPDPDPKQRPEHGGEDRHVALGVPKLAPLEARLKEAGVHYTKSKSGRQALFFRDPDMNGVEVAEMQPWR